MVERWKAWLAEVKRVDDPALFALFDQMVDALGFSEACERSKTFDLATRHGFTADELVDLVGVLSESDHHTCWDRAWAYKQGSRKRGSRRLPDGIIEKGPPLTNDPTA